jgi:hypothetical protein
MASNIMLSSTETINPIPNELDEKTNTDNDTVSPFDAVELIERFLKIYNTKNRTRGSIVEGNNPKDPAFTNEKMEMFYSYMNEHKILMDENPDLCDVYDNIADLPKTTNNIDIYMIVKGKKTEPVYWSYSYLSLLQICNKSHFKSNDVLSIVNIDH